MCMLDMAFFSMAKAQSAAEYLSSYFASIYIENLHLDERLARMKSIKHKNKSVLFIKSIFSFQNKLRKYNCMLQINLAKL